MSPGRKHCSGEIMRNRMVTRRILVAMRLRVTPVPIPNTTVKT